MRHPWSVPVLLALAALAGYAAGARPVQAQSEPLPFSTGDTVTFSYPEGTGKCRIEEIKWHVRPVRRSVRTARSSDIGDRQPDQRWVNVAAVSVGLEGSRAAVRGRPTPPSSQSCEPSQQSQSESSTRLTDTSTPAAAIPSSEMGPSGRATPRQWSYVAAYSRRLATL